MSQFIFTCPFCKQQFAATDDLIGTTAACSNCGASVVVQRQLPALNKSNETGALVLGIIGLLVWIIPLFSIPVPVIGFTLSYNRNYKLGIILNSIGMGLSLMWTILCVLSEME